MKSKAKSVFIVGEMACAHEGNLELARTLVSAAGESGCDAVQLQIWNRDRLMVPDHPDYPKLARLQLSDSDWVALARFSRTHYPKLKLWACIYDVATLPLCETLGIEGIKLHASDLTNRNLVESIARRGIPLHLSVGASYLNEIQTALEWFSGSNPNAPRPALLYGYQNFPTRVDDAHLLFLGKLQTLFECRVGYQDHCAGESEAGYWLPAAAVGMGVDILEKHVTHDRSLKGIDHEAALNPKELAHFVTMVRTIESALGSSVPAPFSEDQKKYRTYAKKTLVAARAIPEGPRLSEEDLLCLRSHRPGLHAAEWEGAIGKITTRSLARYESLDRECLQ